jgi:hypothetical protein
MAKGKEATPVHLVRRGLALVPELDMDAAVIEAIPQGHSVRVEIKQHRSHDRLRAYWATLHEVVKATECAVTAERLHEAMKLELGIVDLVKVGRLTVAIPGSIAFDKMTESEMAEYFQIAERWLAATYGYVPKEREKAA